MTPPEVVGRGVLVCGRFGRGRAIDEASREGIAAVLRGARVDAPPADDITAMADAVSACGLVLVAGSFGGTEEGYGSSLLPACLAALEGRPVMVFGAALTAGILEPEQTILRAVINSAGAVTLRDEASAQFARGLGVAAPLHVSTDPSFALQPAPPDRGRAFLEGMGVLYQGPLIGVAVGPGLPLGAWETHLPTALDDFLSRRGGRVVFIVSGEDGHPEAEHALAGRLQQAMAMWRSTFVGDLRRPPSELAALIGNVDVLIAASRFGATLAAIVETPCVGLDADVSLPPLLRALGVAELACSLSADADGLTNTLERAFDARKSLRRALARGVTHMKALTARDAQTALTLLEGDGATTRAPRAETVRALVSALAGEQRRAGGPAATAREAPGGARGTEIAELEERVVRQTVEMLEWKERAQAARSDAARVHGELRAIYVSRSWKWAVALGRVRRGIAGVAARWRRLRLSRPGRLSAGAAAAVRAAVPGTEHTVIQRQAWPDGVSLAPLLERIASSRGAVVFPPSVGWKIPLAQRPHHLARAFAQMGYVAVFDCTNGTDEVDGLREIEPNLFLFRGPHDLLLDLPQPLVWTVSYNAHFLDRYPAGCTAVYDWIDDLSVFAQPRQDIKTTHRRALERADVVACVARRLQDEARASRPDALYLPNGVEYERFADPSLVPPDDPILTRFRLETKPIVGYYGALAAWFDYELLDVVSRLRSDWNFLLIGPDYDNSFLGEALFKRSNVLWTGTRPYDQLPRYLRLFDVASIPFQINEITKSTSPLKLYEYFAGGKPVVTTAMPECMAYEEVRIARDPYEFSRLLDEARRAGGDAAFTARLRALGHANSWKARVEDVLAHVAARKAGAVSGAGTRTAAS